MSISKEELYSRTSNGLDAFKFYVPEWKEGKNFKSHFRDDGKNPDASIYKNDTGVWYYRDHVNGDHLDCFAYIEKKFNLSFPEALEKLSQDLGLHTNHTPIPRFIELAKKVLPERFEVHHYDYLDPVTFCYLEQFGITDEILKNYNVFPIQSYWYKGNGYTATPQNIFIGYRINNNCWKLYFPYREKFRFLWLGEKPKGFVFGYDQLPDTGKILFITGGEKDVLTLVSNGYNAITLNSESAHLSKELYDDLKARFENIIVCYDIDQAGINGANKIISNYPDIKLLTLPERLKEVKVSYLNFEKEGKDVSDFFYAANSDIYPNIDHFDFQILVNESITKKTGISENERFEDVRTEIEPDSLIILLESFLFKSSNVIPEPEPIISIDGNIISTAGNITVFKGQSKSGKSGALNGILGGFMSIGEVDTIGLTVKPNIEGKFLLHIDSEQSSFNHFKSIKAVLRRAGRTEEPKWFKSYLFRELSIKDRRTALGILLEKYSNEFKGVHAIIIDGIADFCTSVNDEKEANEIVYFFEKLAIKYNCPVITIIHLNPSSETKGRGHLDSQLERKAESILSIKKERGSEISTIEGVYLRNAGSIPLIEFRYDTEKGYHVSCGFKIKPSKADRESEKYSRIVNDLFSDPKELLSSAELVERIQQSQSVKTRAARTIIEKLIQLELITKEYGHTGRYYLCTCAKIVQSA